MKHTINKIKKLLGNVSLRKLKRLAMNPTLALTVYRGLAASVKKDNMDMENEVNVTPNKLSQLSGQSHNRAKKYQAEIVNDDEFYREIDDKKRELDKKGVLSGVTSNIDAQTMYVLCRLVKPELVVQTGVRFGSFDAHISAALNKNKKGKMYSIDLNEQYEGFKCGYLIREKDRGRWELVVGDAKDKLSRLMSQLDSVDLFIHDSTHTKKHMRWEFEEAYENINASGFMASHDVLKNDVFRLFAKEKDMQWIRIRNLGIARK